MSADKQKDIESNLQIMVDFGKSKFQSLDNAIQGLQSKAGILIGFMGIIFSLSTTEKSQLFGSVMVLNVSAVLCMIISGLFFILVLVTKKYRLDPDIVKFSEQYKDKPSEDFNLQLIVNVGDSVDHNLKVIEKKARYFNLGLIALGIGILLLLMSHLEPVLKIIFGGY